MNDPSGLEALSEGERDFAIEVFERATSRIIAAKIVHPEVLKLSVDRSSLAECVAEDLVFSLSTRLAEARSVATIGQEAMPTSWWQHLRKSLGLSKWKGRQVVTRVEIRHVCPHLLASDRDAHIRWISDRVRRESADLQEVARG